MYTGFRGIFAKTAVNTITLQSWKRNPTASRFGTALRKDRNLLNLRTFRADCLCNNNFSTKLPPSTEATGMQLPNTMFTKFVSAISVVIILSSCDATDSSRDTEFDSNPDPDAHSVDNQEPNTDGTPVHSTAEHHCDTVPDFAKTSLVTHTAIQSGLWSDSGT